MNLESPIGEVHSIGPVYKKRLEKIDIYNLEDLLFHFPSRYEDFSKISRINNLKVKDESSIRAKIFEVENIKTRFGKTLTKAKLYDDSGTINAVWFNQPYIKNILNKESNYIFSGKINSFKNNLTIVAPQFEKSDSDIFLHTNRIVPVYSETLGISSKWLRTKLSKILPQCIINLPEILDHNIISRQKLLNIDDAIKKIHFPQNLDDIKSAKKRLAFEELFQIQINVLSRKIEFEKLRSSTRVKFDKKILNVFLRDLPFKLTSAQIRCLEEIISDLGMDKPMNRILQGDVGSGKTIVAAIAAFLVWKNKFRTIILVPTEILALQHFKTLSKIFSKEGPKLGIITRAQKTIGDFIVGTHALLNFDKNFYSNVGLIIVDEQHRFGVSQRSKLEKLTRKGNRSPHFLSMTATPIPRTIALTLYSDLNLSHIDELPPGRQKVQTFFVPENKRTDAYDFVKNHLKTGEQAFIVCPFIEPSETRNSIKAAKQEYEKLKSTTFKNFSIKLLHGKTKPLEKEKTMNDFSNGKFQILVATPVVEVGIDIPKATIMIIEGAERFGLAQLHQLRGRIGRSDIKSFCFLFSDNKSDQTSKRLKALITEHNGTKLADLDLKLRGPGDFFGTKQHGFPSLKIANFFDFELIKKAKEEAQILLKKDPRLEKHKKLKKLITKKFNQDTVLN